MGGIGMIRACKMLTCPNLHSNTSGYCDQHQSLNQYRPCITPGCPNASVFRGRCQQCSDVHSKQYEDERKEQHAASYDERWKELSKAYRAQHRECEICREHGIITQSVLVHHIQPIDQGGDRLSIHNLQALCRACHERIHGRKR